VSLAVGLVAAVVGARWGLEGVIYGVALGWMIRSVSALYVVARHLRLPVAEQAAEPATAP
jgi:Na+-driven multidrug efflux pump